LLPALALTGAAQLAGRAATNAPPFDPRDFVLDPQVTISRWAAEPDIVDPVAMCFDESGRAYVAECRDYPYGAGPDGQVNSTIRLLEDLNGDGIPDRSTVFADKLSYATSVTPWRGGILVAAAPDILFLKDTNNDGVADVREVVLTGFRRGVSDSLVNGLRFHLDGRIHGVNGGNNGLISSPKWRGEAKESGAVDLRDHDFAFQPDTAALELTTRSSGGFGLVLDDWGRTFVTYNINHLQHPLLPRRYAERNPGFPTDRLIASISDHGEMSRIFPVSEARTRPNHPEQAGYFSAAGGMGYLSSSRWPASLQGSVFVCDVVGNLVHRDVIRDSMTGFVASRSTNELDREFLASRDPDFRPVGLEAGPDGALYLLAMQRSVIEHPDYIPAPVRSKLDLRAGSDRGRIYRLAPATGLPFEKLNLTRMKNSELVPLLTHPEQWWRNTAQRLLLERRAVDTVTALRNLARDYQSALGRVHALFTLQGLGVLGPAELQSALQDGHPGVRENALRLAEPFIAENHNLLGPALLLLNDPHPEVRYQAILTVGVSVGEPGFNPLIQQLIGYAGDPRIRLAVLAVLEPTQLELTLRLISRASSTAMVQAGPLPLLFRDVADLTGARAEKRPVDFEKALKTIDLALSEYNRRAILDGLIAGLERSDGHPRLSLAATNVMTQMAARCPLGRQPLVWRLSQLLGLGDPRPFLAGMPAARAGATNDALSASNRVQYVRLLAFDPDPAGTGALLNCLEGTHPGELQQAALAALRLRTEPTLGSGILSRWRSLAPEVRGSALAILLSRKPLHADLANAWEKGTLTVGEFNLDLEQRRRLLRESPPEVRPRFAALLGDGEYANRSKIVEDWLTRLPPTGDAVAGKKLFELDCAKCHRCSGVGKSVGPELTASTHRSVEDLLANILDPNMAMNPRFITFLAETADGESQTGLLISQNPTTITLVQADEKIITVPRKRLTKLESTGRSLMPEGLEQGKTPQNLRDLIAFLQQRN